MLKSACPEMSVAFGEILVFDLLLSAVAAAQRGFVALEVPGPDSSPLLTQRVEHSRHWKSYESRIVR